MSKPEKPKTQTYEGGFSRVIAQMESRRDPLRTRQGEGLPPLDADLVAMTRNILTGDAPEVEGSRTNFSFKVRDLKEKFSGESELCYLNALLIAHLRKREFPAHTAALFQRLWAEQGAHLLARLNLRWLVSSITTFGDHGINEVQRRVGQNLSILLNTMKLYETERSFSDLAPNRPNSWTKRRRDSLPLDMEPYSLAFGGLDVNMLGRLWLDAQQDPVIAPLAQHLLEKLNEDDRNLFRRLKIMRLRHNRAKRRAEMARVQPDDPALPVNIALVPKAKPKPAPDWGVVATVKAPLAEIAAFAAYHIEAGASKIHLYLDDPHPDQIAYLAKHPAITLTACDAAYWQDAGSPRHATVEQRQMFNATRSYALNDVDWLAHIDVDEFLITPEPLATILARTQPHNAYVLLPSIEALAPPDAKSEPEYFKTTARIAGHTSDVLPAIYPTYGEHLRGGFISHLEGKVIARTGLANARLGIHALLHNGQPATNKETIDQCFVGHLHAPDFETFERHLPFRMTKGSYRKRDENDFRLGDIITYLQESESPDALRDFFREVCEATPELLASLRSHNMLLTHKLDLDAKVKRVFGTVPKAGT